MIRGPLSNDSYKPQFSGHETFPMRHGWLKKAYDAVSSFDKSTDKRVVFTDDEAISRFGVGKNMVAAIRHWATTVGIISDNTQTAPLGNLLFSESGLDPYLEHPASLWMIHWQLAGKPDKTTWFWVFSHYSSDTFERDQLANGLERLAKECGWRVASATIKRDVECFVRTYAAKFTTDHSGYEDSLESPLVELGLIKAVNKKSSFRLVRSPKASLGAGVFLNALIDFWNVYSQTTSTLSFEAIAHEPGSPGKVFLLEENDLVSRLQELEDSSHGAYRWSETAGLKQIIRKNELDLEARYKIIARDYAAKIGR